MEHRWDPYLQLSTNQANPRRLVHLGRQYILWQFNPDGVGFSGVFNQKQTESEAKYICEGQRQLQDREIQSHSNSTLFFLLSHTKPN